MSDVLLDPTPPPPPPPPVTPAVKGFDFGKPFTFVFDDPNWIRKIAIGGLFYLAAIFLVGIFFILGYVARLTRNVAAGVELPLPEWDDLGEYFSEGLRLVALWLAYLIPFLFLIVILGVPAAIFSGLFGSDSQAADTFSGLIVGCMYCLIFPLSLALMVWMPAAMLRVIMTRDFASGFELGEIWAFIRANVGNYLLAIVVYLVARFLGGIGVALFCVGVIFTAFWAFLVTAHGFAQVWRLSSRP